MLARFARVPTVTPLLYRILDPPVLRGVGASNNDDAEGLHTLEAVALVVSDAGPRLRWLLQLAAWMLHGCWCWW